MTALGPSMISRRQASRKPFRKIALGVVGQFLVLQRGNDVFIGLQGQLELLR